MNMQDAKTPFSSKRKGGNPTGSHLTCAFIAFAIAAMLLANLAGIVAATAPGQSASGAAPATPGATFVEQRYMRGVANEATVNGLTAYSFGTAQSATPVMAASLGNKVDVYAGIRVWKRSSAGAETEITAGTAVGIASLLADGSLMVAGATWTPPVTAMAVTDSLVIRLYQAQTTPPATQVGVFTTGQLGATQIDAVAWAPSYYLESAVGSSRVCWGEATYNTNVGNIQYQAPDATPPVANAGPDQSVTAGTLVTFDGSASSDNVGITNYWWNFTDGTAKSLTGVGPTYTFATPSTYTVTLTCMDAAGNKGTDTMTVTANPDATAPVANAGPDQTVGEGTLVTFTGAASSDNVGITNYWWNFTDGAAQSLTGVGPTYTFNNVGAFTVTLTCMDAAGNKGTDTVLITVTDATAPVANAGPDQTVDEGMTVTFDGSGSTDNVGIVNYWWNFTDGASQSLTGVGPTYVFNTPGGFTVTLTCMDAAGNKGTDTMAVTVNVYVDTVAPVANAGPDQSVTAGTLVTFDGSASSDNIGIVAYWWNFTDGVAKSLSGVAPTYTFVNASAYTVTLTCMDAAGNKGTDTMTVTANPDATAPVANAGPDQSADEDTLVTFDGSGSTDDIGVTNYTWTFNDGAPVSLYGVAPTHTFATPGTYAVTLDVSDAFANHDTDAMNVTVLDVTAPVADAGADQSVNQGASVAFDGSASTDNGVLANYTWTFYDGASNVTLYGVAPSHIFGVPGDYNVTLNVTDAGGNWDTDNMTVNVTAFTDVTPPVANAGPDQLVLVGDVVSFNGSASTDDIGIASYTWTFTDGFPKTLTGATPAHSFANASVYTVTLNVTDAAGNWDTDTVDVTVNQPPVAVAGPDVTIKEGQPFAVNGSASYDADGSIANYTWQVFSSNWTLLDTAYGAYQLVNDTSGSLGIYTLNLTVTDNNGATDTDSLILNITDGTAPVLNLTGDPASPVAQGDWVVFAVNATDNLDNSTSLNYTWYVGGAIVASGVNVTALNHTFVDAGTFVVRVEAVDSNNNTGSAELVYVVEDTTVPSVSVSPATATIDQDMHVVFTCLATDNLDVAKNMTYTWFVDGVQALTGVNETEFNQTFTVAGTYTVLCEVEDAAGNVANDTAVVTVLDTEAPTVSITPDVASPQAPGTVVTFTAAATDNVDNATTVTYLWSLDGVSTTVTADTYAHNFTAPGTYNVSVEVTDTAGNIGKDYIHYVISDVTDPVADAGANQTVASDATVTFDGSGSSDDVTLVADLNYTWTFTYATAQTLYGVGPTFVFVTPGVYTVTLTVEDAAGNSATDTMTVTVTDQTAPVADAGADQTVAQGTLVTFAAAASTDNIGIVTYTWTFFDGANKTLTGAAPTYTFDNVSAYVVTLTVADAAGLTDTDTVTITTTDATAPVADAGADQSVVEDTLATFDGSASTDNVGVANYTWTFVDAATNVTLYGDAPTYTFATVGAYTVTLTVADAEGNTDTDTVVITVTAANSAPTANAGPDQAVQSGTTVTFTGAGSTDPDADAMTYAWTFTYGTAQSLTGVSPTFTFVTPGVYTVTLTVNDQHTHTDTDTMTVTVTDTTLPTITTIEADVETVNVGGTVTLTAAATDAQGVTYLWTITDADGNVVATYNTATATHDFDAAGTYTATLTVTDASGNEATDTLTITVTDDEEPKSLVWLWILIVIIVLVIVGVVVVVLMMGKKKKDEGEGETPAEAPAEGGQTPPEQPTQ